MSTRDSIRKAGCTLGSDLHIEALSAAPLSVPLREPFVIATGRVDFTRSAEVRVRVSGSGARAEGLGEGACLPPVTWEDQEDALRAIGAAAGSLRGPLPATREDLEARLFEVLPDSPVARVAVEMAVLDAVSTLAGIPLRAWLGGGTGATTDRLETDVTVAIADPARMGELAREWVARGFRVLKVKVGKDLDADVRALEALGRAAPGVRLRVDANAGHSPREAIALASACDRLGLRVECWEQPCAPADHAGMREVADALEAPVVADESVRSLNDLRELVRLRYADGVNLKLGKVGSLLGAYRMGDEARAAGLRIMAGGMVETRLGMTAAAQVACALGGVDFADLDTALLLADDPYSGGYEAAGPVLTMSTEPGLGLRPRSSGPPPG